MADSAVEADLMVAAVVAMVAVVATLLAEEATVVDTVAVEAQAIARTNCARLGRKRTSVALSCRL